MVACRLQINLKLVQGAGFASVLGEMRYGLCHGYLRGCSRVQVYKRVGGGGGRDQIRSTSKFE